SGDTDVIPGGLLPVRVAEERCRMVGRDQRYAVECMYLAAKLSQRLLHAEEGIGRRAAQRKDHLRLDERKLAVQIGDARRDLVRERRPVLRGSALDHIADEHILAPQLDGAENLLEQAAGGADKWTAGLVLGRAGP